MAKIIRRAIPIGAIDEFITPPERNARDTKMTAGVTEGARRERREKREITVCLFSSWAAIFVSRVSPRVKFPY